MIRFNCLENLTKGIWLALLLVTHFVSSKVAFYESENYVGLISEIPMSNGSCINLPAIGYDKASSLVTASCILVYTGLDCTQSSIKLYQGSYSRLANVTHAFDEHFNDSIRSFHKCDTDGTISVDFFEEKKHVAEYKDICGCITLPEFTNRVTHLDNHGNCINLYVSNFGTSPSCTGSYVTLQGGKSYLSENLRNLTYSSTSWKRIMAMRPCSEELTKCMRLEATVIKFEINSDPASVNAMSSASDMSMSLTTTFRNNGTAIVAEEYSAKKSVIEATETTLVKNYTAMQNWSVETGFTTEFSADVPLVSKATVTASLKSAYNSEEYVSIEEEEIRRREVTTDFSVNQKIEIGPCTLYNVNSFVRMVQNYPINYKVYSKVYGRVGRKKLSAGEIKERLQGLEYLNDFDDYTVIAMGKGTMLMDFGMEAVIDGAGVPIVDGCERSNKHT